MATRQEPWAKDETKGTNKIIQTIYQGHTIEGSRLKEQSRISLPPFLTERSFSLHFFYFSSLPWIN
jgi:hypothetical protein